MNILKALALIGLGGLVSACGGVDTATRNAPFEHIAPAIAQQGVAPEAIMSAISIASIRVDVPRSLSVSEANSYYPRGDIVWRGEVFGDRHAQVKSIFEDAFNRTAASLSGETAIAVEARVARFHGITEKARYRTGGVHNIAFDLTFRDAATGEILGETRRVVADLAALGGRAAIEADRRGQTQRVRIVAHLAEVLRQEMTEPQGHVTARLGMFQTLNNF
ncbi:MAG: DUF6778 family protein [Pseudomonadota bacterium]